MLCQCCYWEGGGGGGGLKCNRLQSRTKVVKTNAFHSFFTNVLTCKLVKSILSPSPPTQCCFMRLIICQALFLQLDSIVKIEMGEGG